MFDAKVKNFRAVTGWLRRRADNGRGSTRSQGLQQLTSFCNDIETLTMMAVMRALSVKLKFYSL